VYRSYLHLKYILKEVCMQLIRQGFFREMLQGDEMDSSIFDFIQENASNNEERIVDYLNKGIVVTACGGVVRDVINPINGIAGCPDLKTDGVWVWPGDLEYYVKKYHIKLKEEFINTMIRNSWVIINESEINFDDIEIL